ncbi:YcxB family protein [Nocardia sp. NPDC056611]|uniref:YcxB family protein n=1 Tax=Nocardia sp. NPDC056611 TaxID=3345877 RepID=UPI00366CA088
MNQSWQPSHAEDSAPTGHSLEVTTIADSETTMRLSRVQALARWRSPSLWGGLLLIPLILLSRRFLEFFVSAGKPGWSPATLPLFYLFILAIAIVVCALLTAVAMVRRNPAIAAYTAPGTSISAIFHRDALELALTTGTTTIPYNGIKDLARIGGGIFLRERGTRGIVLPRELFPDAAFEAMGRRQGGRSAPLPNLSKETRAVLIAGAVLILGVGIVAAITISRDSAPNISLSSAPKGCDMVPAGTVAAYLPGTACNAYDRDASNRYLRWSGSTGLLSTVEATVTVEAGESGAKDCFTTGRQEMVTAAPTYANQSQQEISRLGDNGPAVDQGWLITGIFGKNGGYPRADIVVRQANACVRITASGFGDSRARDSGPATANDAAISFTREILTSLSH